MRKKFIINKEFQFKFIFFMLLIGLITLSSTYFVFQNYFKEFYQIADESGFPSNHPFRDLIGYQKDKMQLFFIILASINLLIITISGIWMGHKIAGPIYRIVKCLKEEKGTQIETRENDYFKELPEAINFRFKNRP
jgi:hypothetical protein